MFEPLITKEDIEQEAFLRSLVKGKTVSKRIIGMNLQRQATSQLNYEETLPLDQEIDIPDLREPTASEELVFWARELSTELQQVINDFLENPEERLLHTMEFLSRQGIIQDLLESRPVSSPVKKMNYTTMMRRALPATKDELIIMITRAGTMERPAATVRAFLRRFKNNLSIDSTNRYHWKEE